MPGDRRGAAEAAQGPGVRKGKPKKEEREPSQAELLVQLAKTKGRLFRDAYDDAYLSVSAGGHHETMKLRSRRARAWLDHEFFVSFGRVAAAQAKADALALLEGLALHDGEPPKPVYVRTGESDGRVYIDLGDETHELIEVDARGWRILKRAPVSFVRPKGMLPLPRPVPGGSITELRDFANVRQEAHFRLLVAWLVAAQRPRGPYPILCLQGEHGSSKSTTTRLVRRLVDPNASPVRAAPRELRDLAIAGRAAHVLAFDNLSGLPVWLSDALCRVATGGGFATRALCTDDEEVIFDFVRPVIVNGIDDVATRPDLADRCLVVMLPAIPPAQRRREQDISRRFGEVAPRIYGALLTAVSGALACEDEVRLTELPRMADFAIFATAAERALGWNDGDFIAAYRSNRSESTSVAFDADLVSQVVMRFMDGRSAWSGTATDLLDALRDHASDREKESRVWPAAPHILSSRLRRAAPVLRDLGVDIDLDGTEGQGAVKRRNVVLRTITRRSVPSVPSVQPSEIPALGIADRAVHEATQGGGSGDPSNLHEGQPPSAASAIRAEGPQFSESDAGTVDDYEFGAFAEWLAEQGITSAGAPQLSETEVHSSRVNLDATPIGVRSGNVPGRFSENPSSSHFLEARDARDAWDAPIRDRSGSEVLGDKLSRSPGDPDSGPQSGGDSKESS